MFDELQEVSIVKNELGVPATFPVGLGAIIGGIKVLDHLYAEEKGDYERSEYAKVKHPADVSALETFLSLKTRFISRTTSYIITVCTVDGILRQSYRHFLRCLNQLGYEAVIPDDNGVSLLHQRKEEIKTYLFYRNKVFAHTAFGSPAKDDSRSLQYSSLYYFSGNLVYVKDECFALGGGSVIIDKEESPPELSIVYGYPNLTLHYSLWEHMFTNILENIPREELRGRIDEISIL